MADEAGDKKHEASAYRREKAREQGNVVRSQDLASAMLLLVGILALDFLGPAIYQSLKIMVANQLSQTGYWVADTRTPLVNLLQLMQQAALAVVPVLMITFVCALVVNLAQSGFLWLPDKLNIDFSRIDPLQGLARIFSIQNASRLGFGLLKIGLVLTVLIVGMWGRWNELLGLSGLSIDLVGSYVWTTSVSLVRQTAIALLLLAILDFGFQKWKYEQDLRMTDEEVREEIKSTQGDPQMKARRRRVQRELASQRLMSAVPKSDVVVTNPTELAIALQYDPKTMKAPIVVAKGAELVAARIRKIALEHGVPIVERKPLAQALYKSVDVGQPIPVQEYAAVAEVLKYVYQVKKKSIDDLLKAS